MPNSSALVSIIVPTYNRPRLLIEALKSALNQTHQNIEIIVINDAGEDVRGIVSSFNDTRLIYLAHSSNKGLPAARNTALRIAKGFYIAYLDDDDRYLPHHIETMVKGLCEFDYKVAYSDIKYVTNKEENGKIITKSRKYDRPIHCDFDYLLIDNNLPPVAVVHEKSCLELTGFFDEALNRYEDWDLWIRLAQNYAFLHIPVITVEYAITEGYTQSITSWSGNFLNGMQLIHDRYKNFVKDREDIREIQKKRREVVRGAALQQLMQMSNAQLIQMKPEQIMKKIAETALLHSLDDIDETRALSSYLLQRFPNNAELWLIHEKLCHALNKAPHAD